MAAKRQHRPPDDHRIIKSLIPFTKSSLPQRVTLLGNTGDSRTAVIGTRRISSSILPIRQRYTLGYITTEYNRNPTRVSLSVLCTLALARKSKKRTRLTGQRPCTEPPAQQTTHGKEQGKIPFV